MLGRSAYAANVQFFRNSGSAAATRATNAKAVTKPGAASEPE